MLNRKQHQVNPVKETVDVKRCVFKVSKYIMANYHLHSMSIFLHYQLRFSCAHARVLAFEYKSAFSVLHVHMLILFSKTCAHLNSWKIGQ